MLLHEAIYRARRELKLTQKKLSELSGVQRRQLSTLEKGGNVTLSTVRKVIAHLPNLESFSFDGVRADVMRKHEENELYLKETIEMLWRVVTDLTTTGLLGKALTPAQIDLVREASLRVHGNPPTPRQVDDTTEQPAEKVEKKGSPALERYARLMKRVKARREQP